MILAYLAFNLALTFAGAHRDISWQAHHAARLIYANLPLVIGLTSKNNLVSYLTGFTYESLNIFHRWCARTIIALSLVHVIGRIYINDPPVNPRGRAYIVFGIIGFICFAYLALGSARKLRNAHYTFFITTHVSVFILLIISLWLHRAQMQGWLAAGLGLYVLDRIWRTGRILLYHNYKKIPLGNEDRAWVEALDKDIIKVTVRTRQKWVPGCHVFLHAPALSAGGHPFSSASHCILTFFH